MTQTPVNAAIIGPGNIGTDLLYKALRSERIEVVWSIVVVETIYRRRANGAGVKEAAIQGTAEVNLAILLSTLTTMVVFLPVILMSESAAFSYFMSALGLPVVFALGGSLVVALVFAPLATRVIGRAAIKPNPRWIDWLTARYERVLSWTLRRRTDSAMALLAMVLLTGGIAYPGVKCTGEPGESMNEFMCRFSVTSSSSSSCLGGFSTLLSMPPIPISWRWRTIFSTFTSVDQSSSVAFHESSFPFS